MRKLTLSLLLLCSLAFITNAQSSYQGIQSFTFFGVDYTLAKGYGVNANSINEFKTAFEGINYLFIGEPKKYDLEKFFKKRVTDIKQSYVNKVNDTITEENFYANSPNHDLSESQIAETVKQIDTEGTSGAGLIIFAKVLNKAQNSGSYQMVFFDTESREIIASWEKKGKAGGFGLRNFWAGSLYQALKSKK